MQSKDALHGPQRAVVLLQTAGVAYGEQNVVGNLGVVGSQILFAPGDGQLQKLFGAGIFAHGGAHGRQTLEHVVADGIFARQLLRQVPGLQQGLAGAFVIAVHIESLRGFFEVGNGGRRLILLRRFVVLRQTAGGGQQQEANRSHHMSI
jgi:hypothetical protein